jgi:hypothetical protein
VVLPADLPAIRSKAGIVYRSSDVFSAPTAKLIGEFRKIRDELGASDAPFGRCDRAAE